MLHYSWVVPWQKYNNRRSKHIWAVSMFHSSSNSLPPCHIFCYPRHWHSPILWSILLRLGSFVGRNLPWSWWLSSTLWGIENRDNSKVSSSTRQLPLTLTQARVQGLTVPWEGISWVLIHPSHCVKLLVQCLMNADLKTTPVESKPWYIGTNKGFEFGHVWVKSPMDHT